MTREDIFITGEHIADKTMIGNMQKTATIGVIMSYLTNSALFMTQKDAERMLSTINK